VSPWRYGNPMATVEVLDTDITTLEIAARAAFEAALAT
jgi:hypothetical protein